MTATGVVAGDIERYNIITRTARHAKAGATAIFLRAIPEGIVGEEIIIDPAGNSETRTVTAQDDTEITLSSALTYEHEPDVAIIRKDVIETYISSGDATCSLSTNASASDGTVSVDFVPDGLIDKGSYIVIDYQTIECEVIKVSSISGTTITLADNLTYSHLLGDPVMFITSEPVSAKWFAALGDDSNADAIPLSRGAIQACRVNKAYHIPAGTYRADIEDVTPIMNITAPITVYGDGMGSTIIKFLPDDTPAGTYEGATFKNDNTSEKATIRDITLYGPSTYTGELRAISIYGGDTTYLGDVDIINVHVDNYPQVAVQIGTGRRTVTIDGCVLQAYDFIINHSSNPTYDNYLHVYRTKFLETKATADTIHMMYINPGVSCLFEDCEFGILPSTGGYVFHYYGSGGSTARPPYYSIFRNCLFKSTLESSSYAPLRGSDFIPLEVRGCTFLTNSGGVQVLAGGGIIDDCVFECDGGVTTRSITCEDGDLFVTNCKFYNKSTTTAGGGVSANVYDGSTYRVSVSNSDFIGCALAVEITDGNHIVTVNNCIFDTTVSYPDTRVHISIDADYAVISNCIFRGNDLRDGAVQAAGIDADSLFIVLGCIFETSYAEARTIWARYAPVYAYDNIFIGTGYPTYGEGSHISHIHPGRATYPSAVASASNVVLPSYNHDTYHISGTTTINTIYLFSIYTSFAVLDGVHVYLIADGAWSLSTAGNIIPLHTGARVANSVVHLVYDATNEKWYEITPFVPASEITDELTTITHTAPGTPDYAIQDLTTTTPYGFVTKDEGNSVLAVVANLQARVNELEAVLVAHGLLADAD